MIVGKGLMKSMDPTEAIETIINNIADQQKRQCDSRALCEIALSRICGCILSLETDDEKDAAIRKVFASLDSDHSVIAFAREFSARKSEPGAVFDESGAKADGERICYLRSAYSDRAYEEFAKDIKKASCEYHDGYESLCASVADGSCDACILPSSTPEGGALLRIRAIAQRYELKRSASVRVPSGDSFAEFSLYRRALSVAGDERGIEIAFVPERAGELSALLVRAALLGMRTDFISTLPEELSSSGDEYCISFECRDADVNAFLFLLHYLHPRARLTGAWR